MSQIAMSRPSQPLPPPQQPPPAVRLNLEITIISGKHLKNVNWKNGKSLLRELMTSGGFGLGTGLAVGAIAGALGGIALDEGLKYEQEKLAERVDENYLPKDDFSDYRGEY